MFRTTMQRAVADLRRKHRGEFAALVSQAKDRRDLDSLPIEGLQCWIADRLLDEEGWKRGRFGSMNKAQLVQEIAETLGF